MVFLSSPAVFKGATVIVTPKKNANSHARMHPRHRSSPGAELRQPDLLVERAFIRAPPLRVPTSVRRPPPALPSSRRPVSARLPRSYIDDGEAERARPSSARAKITAAGPASADHDREGLVADDEPELRREITKQEALGSEASNLVVEVSSGWDQTFERMSGQQSAARSRSSHAGSAAQRAATGGRSTASPADKRLIGEFWGGAWTQKVRTPTHTSQRVIVPASTDGSMPKRIERQGRQPRRRGAHAHQPLRNDVPHWLVDGWPRKHAEAADAFDLQHAQRWDLAEAVEAALTADPTNRAMQKRMAYTTIELQRGRFVEPVELAKVVRYAKREHSVAKAPWTLEGSIWRNRKNYADSGDYWDTDEVERRMFDTDWHRSLMCGLDKYICKMDDGPDGDEGGKGKGLGGYADAVEVTEVSDVLWQYHDLINCAFDFYAAMGSSSDVTSIQLNAFTAFVLDCSLADKASQFCQPAHFGQLFIAVDAGASHKSNVTGETHNSKNALNRQEFMHALVRIGVMKYVLSGNIADVSDAVYKLMVVDIEPRLDPRIIVEANDFRSRYTYTEAADGALRKHEATLRFIYERATKLHGLSHKMIRYEVWKEMCRHFELIDSDLSDRDVTLAFVWSRTRVVDEQSELGRVKLMNLSFEDFLEALCRCAPCKAWPTREEIEAAGTGTAARHLRWMRTEDVDSYEALMATRAVPWGEMPKQHISTCIDNLCSLLIIAVQGQGPQADGLGPITERQVDRFLKPFTKSVK